MNIAGSGGIGQIGVVSNAAWTARSTQAWISLTPTSGTGNGGVSYTILANPSADTRSASIIFSAGSILKTVAVTQAGVPNQTGTQQPIITDFTPTSGIPGTKIIISGTNFSATSSVKIGNSSSASFTIDSPTQITVIAAQGSSGTISITNPAGTGISTQQFIYQTYIIQSLPSINVGMNAPVQLKSALTTLPTPKVQQFNYTVLSTSANGSLVRASDTQKAVAALASESVLKIGDTFTNEELNAGKIIFKTNAKPSGANSTIELSVPAGIFADDARVLVVNLTLMATGVRDAQQSHTINVYPNPTTDAVTFETVTETAGTWDIQLVNALGTIVQHVTQSALQSGAVKHTLQLQNLPPGVYFLDASDGVQHYRTRLVKQ